jgi:nucleoside-diphosphate-sugar epimerase
MSGKSALITGATGAIGPSLVALLLANGYVVRTYSRQPPIPGLLPVNVEHFCGDINDRETLASALTKVDVVFHLAAKLHLENPSPDMEAEYRRVNVDGTRTVAEQAAYAGVRRFIHFSTVKVYGTQRREPVTEAHSPQPKTLYARTKLEGEWTAQSINGLETVVLRLSPVYGPRLKGSWNRLVRAIRKGIFLPIGNLQNVRSLTYVDDVARAAQFAAESSRTAGEVCNVVGHEIVTMSEIYQAIYTACGRTMPAIRLPTWSASIGGLVLEKLTAFAGRQSLMTADGVRQLVESETYSGQKLRSYGFRPLSPWHESWHRVLSGKETASGIASGMSYW